VVPFKFSFRRMASFCRGLRMKIVLIRYCLFFVNQSKISTARERFAFSVAISFITSVKHALVHRCSLNFTKVKLCQTKSTLGSFWLVPSRLSLSLPSGARGVMGRTKARERVFFPFPFPSPPAPAARVTRRRLGTSQREFTKLTTAPRPAPTGFV